MSTTPPEPVVTPPAPTPTPVEPPKPAAPAAKPNGPDGFPIETPTADMAPEQVLAYWKHKARKHEDAATANAAAAAKLAEIEDANATEVEKATKAAAKAQADATSAQAELAVVRAAVKHGVSEDDLADFSEAVGSHGTAEELAARAEKLAPRFKTVAPPVTPPKPNFGGGDLGEDITGGADTLDGQIAEAQKAGNLQLTIALKQKRSAQLLEKKS